MPPRPNRQAVLPIPLLLLLPVLLAWLCGCGDDTQTPAPAAPEFPAVEDLHAQDVNATSVRLSWTNPEIVAAKSGVVYDIRSSPDSAAPWEQWTPRATTAPGADPGASDSLRLENLETGVRLAIGLRWGVEGQGWSPLSNIIFATPGVAGGRTWRLKADGSGDAANLQDAVVAADSGDLILLAPGRYTWSAMVDPDDTYSSDRGMIYIRRNLENLEIRSEGGAAETILDGEGQGRLIWFEGYNHGCILDGLTITGGVANEFAEFRGGGITGHLSSPTIRNCIIEGNRAEGTPEMPGRGGGIYWGNFGPDLEGCIVRDNLADFGGGVFFVNSSRESRFERCVFRANRAVYDGGAFFTGNVLMAATGCILADNVAERTGGVGYMIGGTGVNSFPDLITFTACTLVGNASPEGSVFSLVGVDRCEVSRSIVAFNRLGPTFDWDGQFELILGCSDVYGNRDGDQLPTGASVGDGMIALDPGFCDWSTGEDPGGLMLQASSPCVDGSTCDRMGALPVGCAR